MDTLEIAGLLLIIATVLVSYKGLTNPLFFEAYSFSVGGILQRNQYKRLFTSAFLHGSWVHLLVNMISLYCFSAVLESYLGPFTFLALYATSLIGGNLLSLYIHRHDSYYSAIGASGAVCGVIFASIALFPELEIGFPGIDYYIPGWAYGLCFVLYSIWGIKAGRDNIGHDAHLGGGISGLLLAIALEPASLTQNYLPILLILLPSLYFLYRVFRNPEFVLTTSFFQQQEGLLTKDDYYHIRKKKREQELNALLDKIHEKGIDSLSKKEKEKLEEISQSK